MLVDKKCFLIVVASLLVFSCGVYAQVAGTNQNKPADAVSATPSSKATTAPQPQSVAKDVSAGTSGVAEAQLMNTIKSMNAAQDVSKQQPVSANNSQSQQQLKPLPSTTSTASTPPVAASQENSTQIELELNKKVSYKIFYLNKPDRLVIDIKDSSFSAEFDKSAFAKSPIKNIRTAHRSDGVFRIVFDLKEAITFQHSEQIGSGSNPQSMRLIITILPKEAKNKGK